MSSEILSRLNKAGQTKLAEYLESAPGSARARIEAQICDIDLDELPGLIADYVMKKPETAIPADLAPAPFLPFPPDTPERDAYYHSAAETGRDLIRQGKVAALTVAGGQGTRLGFDGPKGTYPITPVLHKTLFQYFAEGIARISEKYGVQLPWFIMTSELNDAPTRDFFRKHDSFGLKPGQITFFTQGTMPAVGYDGQLILAAADSLALAPNGHGGTLLALRKSGALDAMKAAGVEYISYFQVDNPLVSPADPLFIGLHALEKADISCRMLPKTNPYEKLGNFCMSAGRCQIIEYSDMPAELAERKKPDGTLDFLAGSPAIHVISRSFVERLTESGKLRLPWHRADKKVAFLGPDGSVVKPDSPNAVKLESFIFDALPLADKVTIFEGDRKELFAPTKNATGVDSAESCRAMLSARDARRLKLAGIAVPDDAVVEISPRSVADDEDALDFFRKNPVVQTIRPGEARSFGK